ncbi:hypothetical protein [Streptomyces sp. ADI93-02]|uniref:hypothetical protein n=1 Tax=Streptomyces sp. ADI93-02 TaxID=1522757 RepID=UPI000F553265|nr:hypothetical protein [Streptomyces sp. ADI93-02]RPK33342.1 hypothetical protein EES40_35670 [Streptomyces sp. ADI93-02]
MTLNLKRSVAVAGTTVLASVALLTGTSSAVASASTYKICAYGNYDIRFEVPQVGKSGGIQRGACATVPVNSGTSYAKIWGYNSNHSSTFYVGTGHFKGSAGGFGYAQGSASSPYLFTNQI